MSEPGVPAPPAQGPVGGAEPPGGRPWSAFEPMDALLAVGLVILGIGVIGGVAFGLISSEPERTLVALLLQGVLFVGVPFAIASRRAATDPWRAVGYLPFRGSDMWLVGGAFLAQVAVTLLFSALILQPEQDNIVDDLGFDETTLTAIAAVVAIVVLAPIGEETLFRGLIFGALRSRTPFLVAALISGVAFGAVHLPAGNLAVGLLLMVFGVLLAWLYERTGSLGPPIVLHAINNTIAILPLIL